MRIISGQYKGLTFHPPKGIKARPTTDRAKEALFNTLANQIDLEGVEVLDLFSGTGNVAYEFASRGAGHITCVDQNYHSCSFIKNTFKDLGFDQYKVVKSSVGSFLKRSQGPYDVIFADPPYAMDGIPDICEIVLENGWLKPRGMLVIEHFKSLNISHSNFTERREYGQSVFSYFRN